MPEIDLRKIKYAKYDDSTGSIAYSGGRQMGEAMTVDMQINVESAPFYSEGRLSENIVEFTDGTLGVGVKDLDYQAQSDLYGHKKEAISINGVSAEELISNKDDAAAYVGVGFIAPAIRNGVRKYRALNLRKLIFSPPGMSFKGKEKTITYATPTTTGVIMPDLNGDWRREVTVDTMAIAEAYIDGKLAIGASGDVVSKTILAALIDSYSDLVEGNYTPSSWTVFNTAYTAAQTVNANASATQVEVNIAVANLLDAYEALVAA